MQKSRCVDLAALDTTGTGSDFGVYGSTSSTGKVKAVAVNGNLTGSGGIAVKDITGWISSDGMPTWCPTCGRRRGIPRGRHSVAWLAAEQNDTHQPTKTNGSYVLWACSFGRDFH